MGLLLVVVAYFEVVMPYWSLPDLGLIYCGKAILAEIVDPSR